MNMDEECNPPFESDDENNFLFDIKSHLDKQKDAEPKAIVNPVNDDNETSKLDSLHTHISGMCAPQNLGESLSPEAVQNNSTRSGTGDENNSDARSVYVGNVDYSATVRDLTQHFESCGKVNRVTIASHKATGRPKGYAYLEFSDKDSMLAATALSETTFKGRVIKVIPKRANVPGLSNTNVPTRGGFSRGGARGRGSSRYRAARYVSKRGRGGLRSRLGPTRV